MSDMDFPPAPLSPSLPSDFIDDDPTIRKRFLVTMQVNSPSSASSALEQNNTDLSESSLPESLAEPGTPSPQKKRRAVVRDSEPFQKYKHNMSHWVTQARAKKHDSDKAAAERKHRTAALLSVDSLVCFMIGFDYEDRCDALLAGLPLDVAPPRPLQTRSWATLVPYLSKMAAYMESVDAEIAGLCHQVLAVIELQMAYAQRKSVSTAPAECAKLLFAAMSDFKRGLLLLPYQTITNRYMLTSNRGWDEMMVDAAKPDPMRNRAALPLHVNSSLAEAAAFALHIGRKWADLENINYEWAAIKSRP